MARMPMIRRRTLNHIFYDLLCFYILEKTKREKTNEVRNVDEGYMEYYKWVLYDLLTTLKEHNIQKVTQLDDLLKSF
ncbi:MAG: hypothetical protein P8Y97_22635 [Candidatus Lokiarchaeota archaeon]